LVGRGLFDGADAEVDNHGLASRFETPNYIMHRVGKRLFLHTSKASSKKTGFVEIMKLVFARVFPHSD
jgi:hypothetical protein